MPTQKEQELYEERLKKLKTLEQMGWAGFPADSHRTHNVEDALGSFDELSKKEKEVTLAGRIRALRGHGKLVFGNLEDQSGSIQFAVKADEVGEQDFAAFQNFDVGDFMEITGKCFLTKKGERTVSAKKVRMLAKSLRALPEKYHGLKDIETRLRKRYLDLIANPETRELFVKKSRFWRSVREFMLEHGFLEVETPVLENIPGGAEAEPFITHHNALDRDFFLRISLELPLKRLLVAGYEKVFEIGRIFRNEGIDAEHLQDYTQIEFYWAYADYHDLMKFLQEMYRKIILDVLGTLKVKSQGEEVDWGGEWKTYDYYILFKKHSGLDLSVATDEDLKKAADKLGIKYEKFAQRGRLVDLIFKKTVRPKLINPGFLINPPVEIEPLAKRLPDDPGRVQRLQVMAYGTELGKGFSELNDPQDQRKRFEEQMKLRDAGDKEAQVLDEDFVEALEYGMPPAAGVGISERLFSVLMDKPIRETTIFPPMKEDAPSGEGKASITKIAVAVINRGAGLEPWQELNTVAHLNAAFGAREGRKLLYQDEIATCDGVGIKLNIQHAIMLKSASSAKALGELAAKAKAEGLEVAEFTREMLETTDDKQVINKTAKKDNSEVEYLGVLVFGGKKQVEQLTDSFKLYS